MDMLYWVTEYGKVFLGYVSLMFLWTSVVFWKHLRKRTLHYYFGFCVTVPIVIVNVVVLTSGLMHILNQQIIRGVFYGSFLLMLLINLLSYVISKYKEEGLAQFPSVKALHGRYRSVIIVMAYIAMPFYYVRCAVSYCISDQKKKCRQISLKDIKHFVYKCFCVLKKYGLLVSVLLYGMIYFSYGVFQIRSYGFGDLYVHHEWIQRLVEGKIFAGGIYPQGMHCFIYCMNALFGVRIYSILLFLQGIHVAVLMLSAYVLLRRILYWRYSPVFVLMLFLTLDLTSMLLIQNMFRLQITLPHEFGLHTVFLSVLCLINYLHEGNTLKDGTTKSKRFWSDNLFLFTASVAASMSIHFFVVIMACVACGIFVIFNLNRLFRKKIFFPLIVSVFCACMISIAPYIGAMAQGIPFSDSINWAIGVISGESSGSIQADVSPQIGQGGEHNIASDLKKVYDYGYIALYGGERAKVILVVTVITVILCCFINIAYRSREIARICSMYYPVIICSVLNVFFYVAPKMGLPDLMPEGRFFVVGHMMLLAVMIMPVDLIFYGLRNFRTNAFRQFLSVLVIVGIYAGSVMLGFYRGFLYCELTKYSSTADVTSSIIDSFPEHTYTIVSPTDELYPVTQYGWHEELLTFIKKSQEGAYTLPTEHVFIYIEKRPIVYAQHLFFQGPSWLGSKKYISYFLEDILPVSQSPEIKNARISKEEAQKDLPETEDLWSIYTEVENRVILESKAFDWCQRFMERYPSVMDVFYEDDDFVCYFFKQDSSSLLYDLSL